VPRRINLLPTTERVRTTTNYAALGMLVAAVIVVFGLGLGYYLLSSSRSSLQKDVDGLISQRTQLEQDVAALQQYEVLDQRCSAMEETVRSVYAGRTLLSEVVYDLSRAIQDNVWLTSMTISAPDPALVVPPVDGTVVEIPAGGLSIQGNTYSLPDVAAFMVRLELVDALQGITLGSAGAPIGSVDPDKEVRGFSITAGVINTQDPDTPLPVSKVEVEGL